jgi:hypothetical protein
MLAHRLLPADPVATREKTFSPRKDPLGRNGDRESRLSEKTGGTLSGFVFRWGWNPGLPDKKSGNPGLWNETPSAFDERRFAQVTADGHTTPLQPDSVTSSALPSSVLPAARLQPFMVHLHRCTWFTLDMDFMPQLHER